MADLIRKESLTEAEAEKLLNSIDKKPFLERLISLLKYKHLLTEQEIQSLFAESISGPQINLPLKIFNHPSLSGLEVICKYLKDNQQLRYTEIAQLLNRDQRTIWVTYNNSRKKDAKPLSIQESPYQVPLEVFSDRSKSVLESLVFYLKTNYSLKNVEIAKLIGRDERNIWAIYSKAERKNNTK